MTRVPFLPDDDATGGLPGPAGASAAGAGEAMTGRACHAAAPSSSGREPVADDLQLAGLVPLSTVDWPGKLVATVFAQGCPWNCPYCHNPSLIDCTLPGTVPWSQVTALLRRRQGLLDGIVFTGGEATRQRALVPAMREVRELGFQVGLHTAGSYPGRLRAVLPLTDWVGLDIKALPQDYAQVAGVAAGGPKAWDTLRVLLDSGVGLEVRLTVYPDSAPSHTAGEIARRLVAEGVQTVALQRARTEGTRAEFASQSFEGWDEEWAQVRADVEAAGIPDLIVRD